MLWEARHVQYIEDNSKDFVFRGRRGQARPTRGCPLMVRDAYTRQRDVSRTTGATAKEACPDACHWLGLVARGTLLPTLSQGGSRSPGRVPASPDLAASRNGSGRQQRCPTPQPDSRGMTSDKPGVGAAAAAGAGADGRGRCDWPAAGASCTSPWSGQERDETSGSSNVGRGCELPTARLREQLHWARRS